MSERRRGALACGAFVMGIVLAGQGCGCGREAVTAPVPPSVSAIVAIDSSAPVAPSEPAPAFDPRVAEPLLADPRLGEVAAAVDLQDFSAAARALDHAMLATPPTNEERPRWLYQLGRLHALAHEDAEATSAYSAAAKLPWSLAGYAALGAATSAVRAGHHDEALAIGNAVAKDVLLPSAFSLVLAEAHEARGEMKEALAIWQPYLASQAKPPRWADISLRAAKALLPTDPGAALLLARQVAVQLPAGPLGERAEDLEQRAIAALPKDDPRIHRTTADELARATALLDAGKSKDAEAAARGLEAELSPAERTSELGCKTATLAARVRGKRKDKVGAAELYGVAIDRCQGDLLATALFQGGVASDKAGRPAEAMARYERVERDAKSSRYADDARVKGSIAALALGDEARFSSMLERIADDYPDGDSVVDGLFRLALHRIEKNDWAGAAAPLETSMRARPHEKEYWAAGRARYFHARAMLATGDRDRAKEELQKVILEQPLTYYMALAHARLAELDPSAAAKAMELAAQPSESAPPAVADHPAFHTEGFARAVELLKEGDLDFAKAELQTLGLTGPNASPGTEWAVAALYGSSGAFALAHSLPRGKLSDWLEHYPVGGWRSAWEVAYPRPFEAIVTKEAKASGIPSSLAYAIMREESAFDDAVISGANAHGLMQLILPTGRLVGKKLGLAVSDATIRTPKVNIALGCRFLGDLRASFPDCPALAIPSYNAGPGAPKKWLSERPYDDFDVFVERIPYEETRNYTKRVLKSYLAYLYLYEPASLPEVLRLPLHAKPSTASGPAGPPLPETMIEEDP